MAAYFRQDFLQRDDGVSIYFQVQGEGETCLVLNDGLGCDGFAWRYLVPELRKNFRVLRWHYRGHGRSPMPREPEKIGTLYSCEDLAAVMDAAHMKTAVVFGHSMGVQIALEFHRRFSQRVQGLVLLCGSYGNPLDTFHDDTFLRSLFPFIHQVVEMFPTLSQRVSSIVMKTDLTLEIALRTEMNRSLMKRGDLIPYFDHLARMNPVAFVRTLDSLKDHSAWDHLKFIQAPTLVIGGEKDRFTPVWLSRRMADEIPDAEFMLVPEGTHTSPLERPGLVNRRIQKFLEKHFQMRNPTAHA